jgi:hypothetical protein
MSLISNNPTLRELYRRATDCRHESEARTFWLNFLQTLVFQDDIWVLSTQERGGADPLDLTRLVLIIEYLNQAGQFAQMLIVESKHARVSPSIITNCEKQASAACAEYMERHHDESKRPLYVLICIGTRAKLWKYTGTEPSLSAVFPPATAPDDERYCDIDSDDGKELYNKLIQIKDQR